MKEWSRKLGSNKKDQIITVQRSFVTVNLSEYFNNDGISYDDLKSDGDFDGFGATYPAEELPPSNSLIAINGVPFLFPSKELDYKNNMSLSGQIMPVEINTYKNLFILGSTEGKNGESFEEEVTVSLLDGTYASICVGLSNWLLRPIYNEQLAFLCTHIHYPDEGQNTIRSQKEPLLVNYDLEGDVGHYVGKELVEASDIKALQSDWKPRIWLQSIKLPFDKPITAFTFMENLNFHVFAMTLELKNI